MANRRMFSLNVVDSDRFTEMPTSSQALYFHLGMRADDDGFISSPKKIIRSLGFPDDDIKILIAKGFVYVFDTGICVITHWKLNNSIQKDRYKKTIHYKEASMITEDNASMYLIKNQDVSILDTECIQNVSNLYTQYSIDKIRLDKDSLDKKSKKPSEKTSFSEFVSTLKESLQQPTIDYLEHCKSLGKGFAKTGRAIELLIGKIKTFEAKYSEAQIKQCLESAIISNWKTIYEPDNGFGKGSKKGSNHVIDEQYINLF